jgi:hypothetical protein
VNPTLTSIYCHLRMSVSEGCLFDRMHFKVRLDSRFPRHEMNFGRKPRLLRSRSVAPLGFAHLCRGLIRLSRTSHPPGFPSMRGVVDAKLIMS